jgi:hypothetical protein
VCHVPDITYQATAPVIYIYTDLLPLVPQLLLTQYFLDAGMLQVCLTCSHARMPPAGL